MNQIAICTAFLKLGLSSFGGPTAHIGFFREEFVKAKRWIGETDFSYLLAICQFLPGPTSSQLAFAIGMRQGGSIGAYAALLSFSLPSILVMTFLGIGYSLDILSLSYLAISGLSSVAIPVVGVAVFTMYKNFCTDNLEKLIFLCISIITIYFDLIAYPLIILITGWLVGLLFLKEVPLEDSEIVTVSNLNKYHVYTVILLGIIAFLTLNFFAVGSDYNLFRQLFNTGFLVFGGGHVVLPLLQGPFINSGLVSKEEFLLGYGIAQAIPGPLFSFASYLGSLTYDSTVFYKLLYGFYFLIFLYSSTFVLTPIALYFWSRLSKSRIFKKGLKGVNIAVSAILFSSYLVFVIPSIVNNEWAIAFTALTLIFILILKFPIWITVLLMGCIGYSIDKFLLI